MPSDRVQAAIDELKEALADEGMDPGTTEAQLKYILPPEPTVVGNYADLQRMGAAVLTGTIPTPPIMDDVQTSDVSEAFVMPPDPQTREALDNEGGAASLPTPTDVQTQAGQGTDNQPADEADSGNDGDSELSSMTKAELLEEAGRQGVDVSESWTKAEIQAAIEGA